MRQWGTVTSRLRRTRQRSSYSDAGVITTRQQGVSLSPELTGNDGPYVLSKRDRQHAVYSGNGFYFSAHCLPCQVNSDNNVLSLTQFGSNRN